MNMYSNLEHLLTKDYMGSPEICGHTIAHPIPNTPWNWKIDQHFSITWRKWIYIH